MARDRAILAAVDQLAAADFPAGADEMLALLTRLNRPFNSQGQDLADAWMDRWLQVDTRGALRFLSSSTFLEHLPLLDLAGWPIETKANGGFGGVFKALTRREPDWTRQFIAGLKTSAQKEVGTHMLLREMAAHDRARAEEFLASFTAGPQRPVALRAYISGLVTADVRAGFDAALTESPGPLRDQLLDVVFRAAGDRGVKETRELLDRIEDPAVRRKHAAAALSMIGFAKREDPLPFIKEESERLASDGGWPSDLSDWASSVEVAARGPQAAEIVDWASAFGADSKREMFQRAVETWAGREPAAFGAWLSERVASLDPAATEALRSALGASVRLNIGAARVWSEALPPGPTKDLLRFQVALGTAETIDVSQAGASYQSVAAADSSGLLASQLAAVMLRKDGTATADWAMQLKPGAARKAALEVIGEQWSTSAPHEAAEWLEQVPAGRERDTLVKTYASRVALADPSAAALWVEQVSDSALKTESAREVYNTWSISDPAVARDWLRNLPGIEPGTLAKLLRN